MAESASYRVAAMTGSGVSAESGIATFRGMGGMWENIPIEEVASPPGFARDPKKVWEFYQARREQCSRCEPNPGHFALARLEEKLGERFALVTQNVDGLHRLAGNMKVLELHGSLWTVRCMACKAESENRTVPFGDLPPSCECGGMLRPGVVWFGEPLPERIFQEAFDEASLCDLFIVAGTSGGVEPAASLARVAASNGADVWEINPEPTPLSHLCEKTWRAPSGEVMNQVVDEALRLAGVRKA